VNGNALEQVLEFFERDEALVGWSSVVAVDAVFDAEFVGEQIEFADGV